MTTTTLSSKQRFASLLGQLLRRNLSTSIYLFVIMFVFLPLQMFFETHRQLDYMAKNGLMHWDNIVSGSTMYTQVSAPCMIGIMVVSALVIGLIQCSYLHSKRAVDLYHSLPVSRTQLMLAGFVSSFATIAVPYVINYIINLGISIYRVNAVESAAISGGIKDFVKTPIPFGEVALDMLGWLVTIFAILAIVNLVATQVGSVFENFVFVCELLVAPALIVILNNTVFEQFLTGYADNTKAHTMLSITPATFMLGRMHDTVNTSYYNVIILVWLVLGIAIMWAATWMYNRRRSEIAETSGCKGILGFAFSTIAVYLASPVVGIVIFSGFGINEPYIYVIGVVLGAVLSFLLVEAILNRGFAGIRCRLPQGGAVCAFVIAVAVVVTTGGLGYEVRLPDATKVKSVTINSRGWYEYAHEVMPRDADGRNSGYGFVNTVTLSDQTTVNAVIAVHQRLIAINQEQYSDTDYWGNYKIEYDMGGGDIHRYYDRTNNEVDALLMQLEDTEAFQREANPVLRVDPTIIKKATLHNNLGFAAGVLTTNAEIEALLDALGKDSLEQGTAPYVGGEPVACYIYFETPRGDRSYYATNEDGTMFQPQPKHYNSFSVPVFDSYKHTLAQLGSNLPAKATAADVIEVGLGSYYYSYSSGRDDRFVSTIYDKDNKDAATSDMDAFVKQQDKIEEVIEQMVTSSFISKSGYQTPLFCTFYNGKERGITVMIANDAIPQGLLDEFPDLTERYQQMKDKELATANSIETVDTKTFAFETVDTKTFTF